jgi:hypothetical protein
MRKGCRPGEGVAGIGALLFAAVVILLLAKGLYPADLPRSRNPDFVDNVFDNRGVLWAARLLLVSAAGILAFGGIFIVVSIGVRMKNGDWLRRAGPFEISEGRLDQVEEEADFWRQSALTRHEEILRLRDRLGQSEAAIEHLKGLR